MKVFTIQNNNVVVLPEILVIPAFYKIYKRDRTKDKVKSCNEFAYIYHTCDWSSPYRNFTDPLERKERVKKAFMKDDNWKEDADIIEAIKTYDELSKTPLMGLLEDSYHLIDVLRKYFRSANLETIDSSKAMSSLEKLAKVVDSMKGLEAAVAKEKVESSQVRGNKMVAYDEK
jgi:hypothetical protein